MDNIEIYKKQLSSLRGKTIAIVYIFEGEKASVLNIIGFGKVILFQGG